MPAPSSTVITATRAGTVARHLFLYLDHPLGAVRAWNGIGEFVLSGSTYLGVGALGVIQGVSDSTEIQQHDVTATLSGVQYSALRADDGDVRGRACTIIAALIDETGAVVAQRTVFTGKGDQMRTSITVDGVALQIRMRGLLADWSAAPRYYYTPQDQQRLFAGDNGFNYVKSLQNAVVTGWSVNEETSGSRARNARGKFNAGSSGIGCLRDEFVPLLLGNNTYGIGQNYGSDLTQGGVTSYTEETTGAAIVRNASAPFYIATSEGDCYVDINGDVRTPAGLRVLLSADTALRLRKATAITALGTATATVPLLATIGASGFILNTTGGTFTIPALNWSGAIVDNADGCLITGTTASVVGSLDDFGGTAVNSTYVEDVTGTAALCSTSTTNGRLRVGGSDCFVSTTGCVLSPGGRKIIKSGGNADYDFLRVWT